MKEFNAGNQEMRQGINPYIRTATLLLIIGIGGAGCTSLFATPIKKILDNPRDYSGKAVTIAGEVTEAVGLVFVQYFVLKDNTGEITVVTTKPLPRKGSRITVKGKVRQAFSIGDDQLIVVVEHDDR
jgi:hypothetical protein